MWFEILESFGVASVVIICLINFVMLINMFDFVQIWTIVFHFVVEGFSFLYSNKLAWPDRPDPNLAQGVEPIEEPILLPPNQVIVLAAHPYEANCISVREGQHRYFTEISKVRQATWVRIEV